MCRSLGVGKKVTLCKLDESLAPFLECYLMKTLEQISL